MASGFEIVKTSKLGDEKFVYVSKRGRKLNDEKTQKLVLSEIFIRNNRSMLDDEERMRNIRARMIIGSSCSLLEAYNIMFTESEREEYTSMEFLRDVQCFEKTRSKEINGTMDSDIAIEFLRAMQ